MALCSYGLKCGISEQKIRRDAYAFLDHLESLTEDEDNHFIVSFTSYKQFSQLVLDVAEAIDGNLEYAVDYDDSRFNSITVEEVFEVEN